MSASKSWSGVQPHRAAVSRRANPRLPSAGSEERKVVEQLERLARHPESAIAQHAGMALGAWAALLPNKPRYAGGYYTRRPLTPTANRSEWEWLMALKSSADSAREWDKKWLAELLLAGKPELVSNFRLDCLFLLRLNNGEVIRVVRLQNAVGEVSPGQYDERIPGGELLDAKAFCSPEKFRKWALGKGNFSWYGNQTDLGKLHLDVCQEAYPVVNLVESWGWFEIPGNNSDQVRSQGEKHNEDGEAPLKQGLWFFGDIAFGPKGEALETNEYGIYRFERTSYFMASKGRESEYGQGRPNLRPGKKAMEAGEILAGLEVRNEEEALRGVFRTLTQRLYDTVGGHEGWLALGAMLAYAAAPEVFAEYGLFPGLWVHGQMKSGKTALTSWLMAIWGFNRDSGIGMVRTASAAVMLQEAENYSNLPVWLDGSREHLVSADQVAILRNAFNRQSQVKWSPDGRQRVIRTAFVVSGESTSRDAATRSRYSHVHMSEWRRVQNHFEWFMKHKAWFCWLGRLVLARRPEFVRSFLKTLRSWLANKDLVGVGERERIVHGVSYAGFLGVCGLLESHGPDELNAFKGFVLSHATAASEDVTSETNVNVFWQDLLTALKAGEIPANCFRVKQGYAPHPPGALNRRPSENGEPGPYVQAGWKSLELYFDPERVIANLSMFLEKQRAVVVLKRKDLRDQLSATQYWIRGTAVPGQEERFKKLRMRIGGSVTAAWGIRLDAHPQGYRQVSDEEYEGWLMRQGGEADGGDPRKGLLYELAETILKAQEATRWPRKSRK